MHSSWIFSIDNEWIFVVIMKPGPDFGTRILGPQLFSETTTEGSRILDSGFRDLSRASSTCFAILDSGFSGRKSRLISIELKSQLFSLQLERMDSGSWILDLAWHLADFDAKGALSKVPPPPTPSWIPDLGSSLISTGTTD